VEKRLRETSAKDVGPSMKKKKIQNKSKYIIYNELEKLKNKQVKVNTTKHKNSKDWKCRRNKSGKCSVWIYVGSIYLCYL
jgi:hypothetical protein